MEFKTGIMNTVTNAENIYHPKLHTKREIKLLSIIFVIENVTLLTFIPIVPTETQAIYKTFPSLVKANVLTSFQAVPTFRAPSLYCPFSRLSWEFFSSSLGHVFYCAFWLFQGVFNPSLYPSLYL